MKTPRNITELKTEVRQYTMSHPERAEALRENALVLQNSPDLFGWLRLWLEVQYDQGRRISPVSLVGTVNQDGKE